jgi:nucleoside-diphosphate-sugar epimerase
LRPRRLFLAGSTGAVGRTVLHLARERSLELLAHLRPRQPGQEAPPAGSVVFELTDAARLIEALGSCTTVLQTIGTMRSRFAVGDTYESSDIGTTRDLINASKAAGIDHFILVSSVGAGRPVGAYLQAKARAEAQVVDSGLPYTIVRPSSLVGEGRTPPPGMKALTHFLRLKTLEPIGLGELAGALLHVAVERGPLNQVLEGSGLWAVVPDKSRA